jgi:hypothetical protein
MQDMQRSAACQLLPCCSSFSADATCCYCLLAGWMLLLCVDLLSADIVMCGVMVAPGAVIRPQAGLVPAYGRSCCPCVVRRNARHVLLHLYIHLPSLSGKVLYEGFGNPYSMGQPSSWGQVPVLFISYAACTSLQKDRLWIRDDCVDRKIRLPILGYKGSPTRRARTKSK